MHYDSMKYKWDNKNVLDYAVKEAEYWGILKGKLEEAREIALKLKKEGLSMELISKVTSLSIGEIERL